jgi:hypothetical protein
MNKFVENTVISNEENINVFVGHVKVKSHSELTEEPIESKEYTTLRKCIKLHP